MKVRKLDIYEEVLDNGMHVLLVHKPNFVKSLFMCTTWAGGFDITQQIGNTQVKHRTGCAHFLEHQMFRLNGKDVTSQFASMQAQTNAFTSFLETTYYFQTTSDVNETLKLLLDFVQTLDIDDDSIEKEKGIILSEYDMYKQNPEQQLLTETFKSLYSHHPMRHDILGTREDIKDMGIEDLEQFYHYNYDPSQLWLVGITGKDIAETMDEIRLIQKDVTSKISQSPKRVICKEESTVAREVFEKEMDISIPLVCVSYKMEPLNNPLESLKTDQSIEMALECFFSAMNPDFQTWMDQRIISSMCGAECDFTNDHAYVLFYAQTEKTEEFIRLVESIVEKMKHEMMDVNIFDALQSKNLSTAIRSMDQFETIAMDLMRCRQEGYTYEESLEVIQNLTIEEIHQRINDVSFENKAIVKILPKRAIDSNDTKI